MHDEGEHFTDIKNTNKIKQKEDQKEDQMIKYQN